MGIFEKRVSNMKRFMVTAGIATALAWSVAPARLAAQAGNAAAATPARIPRLADGHPDLSGVWWRGADVGGRSATPAAGRGAAPAGGGGGARGGAGGGGGRGPAQQPATFSSLYQPS